MFSALIPVAAPAAARAQAFDQLPGGDAGGDHSQLPLPQAVDTGAQDLTGQPSLLPFPSDAEFLVKSEAEHDPGADLFSPREAGSNKSAGAATAIPYLEKARKEAKGQGVDLSLILALIRKESTFDPKAHNKSGARGLMQVLPSTAKWLGLKDTKQLWTPAVNIKYGVKYLKYLFGEFGAGSLADLKAVDLKGEGIRKTLAAYNAGPGNVRKYNGVPPFKETKNYVEKVAEYFSGYELMF
ncbi:MAG: lytic transglycosylase domain-containing protein [Elusimicrobiota bacterium]